MQIYFLSANVRESEMMVNLSKVEVQFNDYAL